MRKLSLALMFSLFFTCGLKAAEVADFSEELEQIADTKLQKTLENSIKTGHIKTKAEFDATVKRVEDSMNRNSTVYYSAYRKKTHNNNNNNNQKPNNQKPQQGGDTSALSKKIEQLVAPLKKLDKDFLKVTEIESKDSNRLFKDISGEIPASYKATVDLCRKFNPRTNTEEMSSNGKAIDAYFQSIKNDPCIQYALSTTNTSISDMKKNWFGVGACFEHVIAGEVKGSKVSGYHWWYKYYADERDGRCSDVMQMEGLNDNCIFTGSFLYDPDGKGNAFSPCKKPKGGFTIGNSACALLALGHIAIETARSMGSIPGAFRFNADICGKTYSWQVYTMGGTLRSLYPFANK